MMGTLIWGPSYIYGYNMSVIHSMSKPEPMLKKKCNAITYYAVHKSVRMRESLTGHTKSKYNTVDY